MAALAARLIRITVFLVIFNRCLTWDNFEFELFDLVEEVNANFYDVLGVGQDASSADIRKAYRKLTLQLHPDKNKAEDAEEKFRQLVAVYEVLKDEEKRQRYNRVLVEGMPDWKTPVFYYRRARKMGFVELSALLALIITIGQYLFGWAVYVERRLTLEDKIDSKKKKERKKKTKAVEEAEELEEEMALLPRPSIFGLWPFRLPGFLLWCACSLPAMLKEHMEERRQRKMEEEEEEEEDDQEVTKVVRKPKRRKMEVPEYSPDQYEAAAAVGEDQLVTSTDHQQQVPVKGGAWSEEEVVLLAKAVNKFPGGTPKRWEKIAAMVGRSVEEVCSKSKTVKNTFTMNLSTAVQGNVLDNPNSKMVKKNQHISDSIISTADNATEPSTITATDIAAPHTENQSSTRQRHRPTKIPKTAERTLMISQVVPAKDAPTKDIGDVKVAGGGGTSSGDGSGGGEGNRTEGEDAGKEGGEGWTQNQQMIFEWALRHFPKGTDKRWDRIAEQIPGKNKEDCIHRFKYLAELVKKKKGDSQAT